MAQTQIISDNNCGDAYYTAKKTIILDNGKVYVGTSAENAELVYDPLNGAETSHTTYSTSAELVASASIQNNLFNPGFFGNQPTVHL